MKTLTNGYFHLIHRQHEGPKLGFLQKLSDGCAQRQVTTAHALAIDGPPTSARVARGAELNQGHLRFRPGLGQEAGVEEGLLGRGPVVGHAHNRGSPATLSIPHDAAVACPPITITGQADGAGVDDLRPVQQSLMGDVGVGGQKDGRAGNDLAPRFLVGRERVDACLLYTSDAADE